ncbi:glycoside hydrolase family 3 N-terminal domain-containing protein [Treponema sp. C6A8]|uniref:glycoside hydrolase family 3 N-terminal domain-containing protein n=1 Tax=Treponema sp. C6A8 TaxID=1410609 RepID=UPI000484EF88|nr:glycoside hydrolase family 3 N-terminal domain-containing protein [Treponema sp. C6A8]
MKKIIFTALAALFFISCTSKTEKLQSKKEKLNHQNASTFYQNYVYSKVKTNQTELENYIKNLPLEKKIAQLFIENLEGNVTFRSYETFGDMTGNGDKTPMVAGGYLFFSYNLSDTVEETQNYIASIRSYTNTHGQIQPFLAIDQEGGWVNRLKKLTGKLPSQENVGQMANISDVYELYSLQAKKMADIGFDMNLAPVIEVCTDDNREFLDGRSFGDAQKVRDYGIACVNAYENNGIATVIKHFPGNTNTDPHTGLPEIKLPLEELNELLLPFKNICDHAPAGVLMSHARTSALDGKTPACLSKVWVSEILRNEYGYQGIIFSDDIFMGALADNGFPPEKAAVLAIEAGVDCIMTSEKRFAKQARLLYKKASEDSAFASRIDEAVKRILEYKIKAGLFKLEQ